jgi:UDP-N-acetylmuramoylalanine--D-glutamate ligase
VRFRLGAHEESDFTDADLVVVNPAVPPGNRFVAAAERAGVCLDTEIAMFVRGCRGRIAGITGSAGKSTTSALAFAILERAAAAGQVPGRALLGGNIGKSLLDEMAAIGEADTVVLELSSFQLHWLRREGLRPRIGAMTNLTPNHLDWHGTMEAYAEDKSGIVPAAGGVFVANADDPRVRDFGARAPCRVVWTSSAPLASGDAVFWRDDRLVRREGRRETVVLARSDVRLLGPHAASNVAQAAALAFAAGAGEDSVREAVRGFEGLKHRLKPIGRVRGVLCVDDSKSTTPEAAATALRSFDAPVLLLAGGYDKHSDPAPMVEAAAGRVKAALCYGATGPALADRFRAAGVRDVVLVPTLAEAVAAGFGRAAEGDVLLLSPGHASWDQFTNYEARAKAFAEAVAAHAAGAPSGG